MRYCLGSAGSKMVHGLAISTILGGTMAGQIARAAATLERSPYGTTQAGQAVDIAVRDNQLVRQGQILFRIDPEPYQIAVDQAEARLVSARLQIVFYLCVDLSLFK